MNRFSATSTLALATALLLAASVAASPNESAATPPAATPPAAVLAATGERDAAYRAFRAQFDAGHFNEALPYADSVVQLTEALDEHHPDLVRAYDNLGATQYRLGDLIAAERAYQRALQAAEERQGATSPQLIAPLRGLALTYQGSGRDDLAVPLLERAVAISRRSAGLFNPAQRELLEPLIDGYTSLTRFTDADRDQAYLLRIAEHQYGDHDRRLIPAVERLAQWSERRHRHTEARLLWQRLLHIASDRSQVSFYGIIAGMRGIAHTYRLDYQFGPELAGSEASRQGGVVFRTDIAERDPFGRPAAQGHGDFVLDSTGKEVLERALKFAQAVTPPRTDALFALLVDLGDWHLLADNGERAMSYYRQALPYLPALPGTPEQPLDPLAYPSQLLYRPPPAALRHRDQPASLVSEKFAVAEFTVAADGHCQDVKIVEGDATDGQRSSFTTAISKSLYRPRFVDGQPVASEKIRYRESFRQFNH